MMKIFFFLLIVSVNLSLPVFGQEFELDTLQIETNDKKINWSHVAEKSRVPESIYQSDHQIEIRLFIKHRISNDGEFVIINYDGTQFKGLRGDFIVKWSKDFKEIKKVKIKNRKKIIIEDTADFWNSLVSSNIHSLADESKLKGRMKKLIKIENGNETYSLPIVSDGGTFDLELKINDFYRFISYTNPCSSADYYTDINEFKNFCQILKILKR